MAFKTDQNTLTLINEVKKRKKEIAKLEKPNWRTNCSFSYVEGSANVVNIHVESNARNLIMMAAFVHDKESSYDKMVKLLGLENAPEFAWLGFSANDWMDDIKTRISKIQISSKKKKLEELEARLDKLVSPELKAEIELEEIAKELDC